jgi:hypothetical protein
MHRATLCCPQRLRDVDLRRLIRQAGEQIVGTGEQKASLPDH